MNTSSAEALSRWGKVPAWWLMHDFIDADRLAVLAALATYADAEGRCDPSQATLARRLKRSRPWVNRVIAELADAGLLEKTGRTRTNRGTTSCLYRLAAAPPPPVTQATQPGPPADTPCHGGDRSQSPDEQTHYARPAPREERPSKRAADSPALSEVPPSWRPSEAAVAEALRLEPGADVERHAARFAARCASKGYRYAEGTFDQAWLSWFLEDHHGPRGTRHKDRAVRQPPERSPARPDRFGAWAAAAQALSWGEAAW